MHGFNILIFLWSTLGFGNVNCWDCRISYNGGPTTDFIQMANIDCQGVAQGLLDHMAGIICYKPDRSRTSIGARYELFSAQCSDLGGLIRGTETPTGQAGSVSVTCNNNPLPPLPACP